MNFETYRSTLLRIPNSPLNNRCFLEEHYRPEQKDYFLDKDPDVFKVVLKYLRTGHLYVPPCGNSPCMKDELHFWGLTSAEISKACNIDSTKDSSDSSADDIAIGFGSEIVASAYNTRSKIWDVLSSPATSLWAKLYAAFTYFLIIVSILLLIFETTSLFHVTGTKRVAYYFSSQNVTTSPDFRGGSNNHISIYIIVMLIQLFFTVEYILRVIYAPNRLHFVFSFLGGIDLLAVLPDLILFIIELLYSGDSGFLKFMRILRVFRILRIFRVFDHFKNLIKTEVITYTLKKSTGELVLITSLFIVGTLVSATVAYGLESTYDKYQYSKFTSIPEACWWAAVTMTTVGYGDIFPSTTAGKIWSSLSALYGLTMICLAVAILVTNFDECSKRTKGQHKRHC